MADKSAKRESAVQVGPYLTPESVKVMGDSVGVGSLPDEAAKYLAEDVTYKLKQVLEGAKKFMEHQKREKLHTADICRSMREKNIPPLLGFTVQDDIPMRLASGGGRDIFYTEEVDLDLDELTGAPLPKAPREVAIKAHWLAVEGVQPTIPENPAAVSRSVQKLETVDPLGAGKVSALPNGQSAANAGSATGQSNLAKKRKRPWIGGLTVPGSASEGGLARLKPLAEHELSVEQQLYFKEITEACVGPEEPRRGEALSSLTSDPGLHQMLPRLSSYVSEGVKVNLVNNNLAVLIYLMRMVKALLENATLYLEKYLHEMVPAVVSCVVSKQLCLRADQDNHWALRDFAARILGQVCRDFSTTTNGIQTRLVRMLLDRLRHSVVHMATRYGCLAGLSELGDEVVSSVLLPLAKGEFERVVRILDNPSASATDRQAADKIKTMLVKTIVSCLLETRSISDSVDVYRAEFGPLGAAIHAVVLKARQKAAGAAVQRQMSLTMPSAPAGQARGQPIHMRSTQTITATVPQSPLVRTPTGSVPGQQRPSQKFYIMQSQGGTGGITPAGGVISAQGGTTPTAQTSTMRFITTGASGVMTSNAAHTTGGISIPPTQDPAPQ